MKISRTTAEAILLAAIALVIGGCGASMQARSAKVEKSLLVNPAVLSKGSGDQALYRYVNPQFKIDRYSRILIEPVLIEKQGELNAQQLENYQKLANNAYLFLKEELGKDYAIVTRPEPGTLRLQMGIIEADSSKAVRTVLSSLTPVGIGLSVVQYGATGKTSGAGEITAEFKITDAMTGELLGAAVDRRVGGKDVQGVFDAWHNANDALQYWARRFRYVLCRERGDQGCIKP